MVLVPCHIRNEIDLRKLQTSVSQRADDRIPFDLSESVKTSPAIHTWKIHLTYLGRQIHLARLLQHSYMNVY